VLSNDNIDNVLHGVLNATKGIYWLRCDSLTGDALIGQRLKNSSLLPCFNEHIICVLITEWLDDFAVLLNDKSTLEQAIPFFTKYERNWFIYCAHPNYRGAHHDWAQVQWDIGNDPIMDDTIYCNWQQPNHA
jgi:hypothetical protein